MNILYFHYDNQTALSYEKSMNPEPGSQFGLGRAC